MGIKGTVLVGIGVLAIAHFSWVCLGAEPPKPQYECKDIKKGNWVCTVTLKVNETLMADCKNASMFNRPAGVFMRMKEFCMDKEPRKSYETDCTEKEMSVENKNRVVSFFDGEDNDRLIYITNKNNKSSPVDFPMISWSCKSGDKSTVGNFNVKFSKEINTDIENTQKKSVWVSGAWGITDRLSTAIFFSAAVAMASIAGISV